MLRRLLIMLGLATALLAAARAPADVNTPAARDALTVDIADLGAKIDAARARVQGEIFELERLHAALSQDAFVASATQQQRDQIQALLWQIRRFSVP